MKQKIQTFPLKWTMIPIDRRRRVITLLSRLAQRQAKTIHRKGVDSDEREQRKPPGGSGGTE